MNRYQKVLDILDNSIGGPTAMIGFHGAFWRGLTRDNFVTKKVFGLSLVQVGSGSESMLVKALKGESPFGADINPDDTMPRMPVGFPPVAPADIEFISKWIDEGCLEDEANEVLPLTWRKTNAPTASSRTDDIWFVDPDTGWAVNSDGNILKTTDGGQSWVVQQSTPGLYLRCVAFANASIGWVGTLTASRRLLSTTDGGATWQRVTSLPANAPVAVCGMSVVNDQVVYCSGTNRPNDFPRMMKTTDGGIHWTAWDMSAHASILIDCFFDSPTHGWVVGGKASEPTPTTRDKLKPVVLETSDGGATWTNRLAGREADFPFGEWGWKIQFLNANLGFVSLENFSAAALLKTTDGGQTWNRIKVLDPQGNVNLEGVGFVDEMHGWVGGWGPGGFSSGGSPQGLSSSTNDGGATWQNANDIGLFINRFRFFGNPVTVGYASGETVYKYSSEPQPQATPVQPNSLESSRRLLPQSQVRGEHGRVPIKMNVPAGTRRLSLLMWTRFGEEVGYVLDEINPVAGERVFEWDGHDSDGKAVPSGDYIVRIIADDQLASCRVRLFESATNTALFIANKARRTWPSASNVSKYRTIAEFVQAPEHDMEWLKGALQKAIELELSTLPPYLTARWSIKNADDPVAESIAEIRAEEMLHFALACNLLAAIGGSPNLTEQGIVPEYPGPLPGGVRPGLVVALRKLSKEQAAVFMDIEYPQSGPISLELALPPVTIGEFYESILQAFRTLNPPLSTDRQLQRNFSFGRLFKVDSLSKVEEAINLINLQGEGSSISPEEADGDLAHHYRFGEIYHERKFVKNSEGHWGYTGEVVNLPEVHDMADIPAGGYQQSDVPDLQTWDLIARFDRAYSEMLRQLQAAWVNGNIASLGDAIRSMYDMAMIAEELIQKPLPDGQGTYGPCFRYVP